MVLSFPQADVDAFACYGRLDTSDGPAFLLETGRPPLGQSTYSFFGHRPSGTIRVENGQAIFTSHAGHTALTTDPLDTVIDTVTSDALEPQKHLPPFVGGAVGYLSYDYVRRLERLPSLANCDVLVPDLHVAFYETVGAIDHADRMVHLMFTPSAARFRNTARSTLYEEGLSRLHAWHTELTAPMIAPLSAFNWQAMTPLPGQTRAAYMERVLRCQDYIRAGDIYQANLSHRFSFDLTALDGHSDPSHAHIGTALYDRLRRINPSPFAGLMTFDDLTLVSCSPERLVRQRGRLVDTRPIAGTRPRGTGAWEDDRLKHELLANEKERAEHVMLVDLERNDLGRVCEYCTVAVDEFLAIEQYSHVSHLVSNVRGKLRDDRTGADVLRAVFPGGTITGVPKVRCMQIIDELEPVRRGIYTGALGYVSRTGDMDWNILIRTMLLTGSSGYLQVGAGIVADSDPAREYDETMHKGQAFFSALSRSYEGLA